MSNAIRLKMMREMMGKFSIEDFLHSDQSVTSIFNSRWGYIWELNPGSIPIFAYSA